MDYVKRKEAMDLLKEAGTRSVKCPVCHTGEFMGTFFFSCTNYECDLYHQFAMDLCHICKQPRVSCTC
jgi:hypothetical protein